jgi:hypothetical protein
VSDDFSRGFKLTVTQLWMPMKVTTPLNHLESNGTDICINSLRQTRGKNWRVSKHSQKDGYFSGNHSFTPLISKYSHRNDQ